VSLLEGIKEPSQLRALTDRQLQQLAGEIRTEIIATVSRNGGHLGPNLGIVEMTIALHRVFDSPNDCILFDTGHQAYTHKLLTGRAAAFRNLRQQDGLSGYPHRGESVHDVIENSHASTALSYADGIAKAFALRQESDRHVVAVIGDGALTGGMAWEALNNIGESRHLRIVVVLNDNGRSYGPTTGGLASHLAALREAGPDAGDNIFEQLGLKYIGPVDGHDRHALESALRRSREYSQPVIVHCVTVKGKGYRPAEEDAVDRLHSPGPFDIATGQQPPRAALSWTDVFSDELLKAVTTRPEVVAITAAMLHPTGLAAAAAACPDQVYDVGIAEQHAVTSAAGLAMAGLHPVVAVYSTFLNRAFDQVLMDVAMHRLPVTIVLDRAGVTGEDGPSHNGMWDLSILYLVPGLSIAAPRDAFRLRQLFQAALDMDSGPSALRFPKGAIGADIPVVQTVGAMEILANHPPPGRRPDWRSVLVISVGSMAPACVAAAQALAARGIGVTVLDPMWVKPLDGRLLELAAQHGLVAVVEDSGQVGGVGDAVTRLLRDAGLRTPVQSYAIPQSFHRHGPRARILSDAKLAAQPLAQAIGDAVLGPDPWCASGRSGVPDQRREALA
jgi:1-deoxy-D-xylulose-5-phosphate synthase